jgi:preprotein translocase subunit Sec61beta
MQPRRSEIVGAGLLVAGLVLLIAIFFVVAAQAA